MTMICILKLHTNLLPSTPFSFGLYWRGILLTCSKLKVSIKALINTKYQFYRLTWFIYCALKASFIAVNLSVAGPLAAGAGLFVVDRFPDELATNPLMEEDLSLNPRPIPPTFGDWSVFLNLKEVIINLWKYSHGKPLPLFLKPWTL